MSLISRVNIHKTFGDRLTSVVVSVGWTVGYRVWYGMVWYGMVWYGYRKTYNAKVLKNHTKKPYEKTIRKNHTKKPKMQRFSNTMIKILSQKRKQIVVYLLYSIYTTILQKKHTKKQGCKGSQNNDKKG